MKKIIYLLILSFSLGTFNACNSWLDVIPDNEQVTAEYWKSKEDVEAVIASGYYYMRNTLEYLVMWGELRGGSIYTNTVGERSKIQDFKLTPSSSYCKWANFYKVINMANSVLDYAPGVVEVDETYEIPIMNSHRTEAYFLRALCHFYLLRNFGEIPLVLSAYVDDSAPYEIEKSSEAEVIEQIKLDITTALNTGAAKERFEGDTWRTKGRATKWALYALMADVCLWSEDYDDCISYCDEIIEATASFRPVFITDPNQWFEIFYPGNSNESIFELNWNSSTYAQTNDLGSWFTKATSTTYQYTEDMLEKLETETGETNSISVRTLYGAYVAEVYPNADNGFIWKYMGTGIRAVNNVRTNSDANFIIYRVADVMLMKAEALVMKGETFWQTSIDILNQIRQRSNLSPYDFNINELSELELLETVLYERQIELAAEGKRWYDLLRFGKRENYKNKSRFIELVIEGNNTTSNAWLRSVLKNENSWYLPIHEDEIKNNPRLTQNPYYQATN